MRRLLVLLLIFNSCLTHDTPSLPILNYKVIEDGSRIDYKIRYQKFTDQYGKTFNEEKLKGRITLVNFFFTSCPSICPPMQLRLAQLRDEFDDEELIIVSHTIDPKNDSTARLYEYSKNFSDGSNRWYFIRSSHENLQKLGELYKTNFKIDDRHTDFFHSSIVTLLDRDSNIRGFYDILVESEKELLKKDLKLLL